MKLKGISNKGIGRIAQVFSDQEILDIVFEEVVDTVENIVPREQENEVYQALIERLQLYISK